MFNRVRTICIPVVDFQSAIDFYVNMLGFKLVRDMTISDLRWVELKLPGDLEGRDVTISLLPPLPGTFETGRLTGIVLECDDVTRTYRQLARHGVPFIQPPTSHYLADFATLVDPDGNQLIIAGPRHI